MRPFSTGLAFAANFRSPRSTKSAPTTGSNSFSVSSNSLLFLRFSAPFPLLLRPYHRPTKTALIAFFAPELANVSVEGLTVYLVLLQSHNILVKLLLALFARSLVESVRICHVGDVKLKIRQIINQKLLSRSHFGLFRTFSHSSPSLTTYHKYQPSLYN